MVWVRLDDHFDEHPKIAALDDHAFALFVCGLAYCNRNLTDGFIPSAVSRQLRGGGRAVKSLVEAGMWQQTGGGWQVHDYSDYQPSKQQVLDEAAKKQAAGKAGGQASATARAQARAQANGAAKGQRFFKQNPSPDPDPVNATSTRLVNAAAAVAEPGRARDSEHGGFQSIGSFLESTQRRLRQSEAALSDEARAEIDARLSLPPIKPNSDLSDDDQR